MRDRIPRRVLLLIVLWAAAGIFAIAAFNAFSAADGEPSKPRVERMRPPGFDSFTAHEQAAVYRAICEAGFMPDLTRPLSFYPGFPSRKPFIECRAL